MSDSGSSSIASGPDNGMLPRRVSNNRADLNGDQQGRHSIHLKDIKKILTKNIAKFLTKSNNKKMKKHEEISI